MRVGLQVRLKAVVGKKAGWVWNLHAIDDGRGLWRPIFVRADLLQLRRRNSEELEGIKCC